MVLLWYCDRQERDEAKRKQSEATADALATATAAVAAGMDDHGIAPSGVSTTGEIIYEDAGALENAGLDDSELMAVVGKEVTATKEGNLAGVSYAQTRLEVARTAAARAAHEREMADREAEIEEVDDGIAAPLFD